MGCIVRLPVRQKRSRDSDGDNDRSVIGFVGHDEAPHYRSFHKKLHLSIYHLLDYRQPSWLWLRS